MINTAKHPVLENLIQSGEPESQLFFQHKQTYQDYLSAALHESLLKDETVLLTVNSLDDIRFMLDKQSAFANYIHILTEHTVPGQTISKLRVRAKKTPNHLNTLEIESLHTEYRSVLFDLKCIYKSCYDSSQKTPGHSDDIEIGSLHTLPIFQYYLPAHIFSLQDSELSELTKTIQKASAIYNPQFSTFSLTAPLNDVHFQLGYENLCQLLQTFVDKATELCIVFLNNLNAYQTSSHTDQKNRKHQAIDLQRNLYQLKEKALQATIPGNTSSGNLLKKLSSSIQNKTARASFQESLEIEFDKCLEKFRHQFPQLYKEYAMVEESTLYPNILSLEKYLTDEIHYITKQAKQETQSKIAQLNVHNCPTIFKTIYGELQKLYADINASQILRLEATDTSFNLINTYERLAEVRQTLSRFQMTLSQNQAYYEWSTWLNKSSYLERTIIDTLIKFSPETQDWTHTIKNFYTTLKNKSRFSGHPQLASKYDQLNSIARQIQSKSKIEIEEHNQKRLLFNLTHLKENDPDTYKTLFKKKYNANHSAFASGGDLRLMKKLFPIMVVHQSSLSKLRGLTSEWDIHFHIDSTKFNMQKIEANHISDKFRYVKFPVDDFTLKNNLHVEKAHYISFDSKEYIKHPKLQTDTDQLNFARSLSGKLNDYLNRIQIFQIEEQYIISFLDKSVLGIFLSLYETCTIKKFVLDHDLNYSLSDILLNDSEKIIVLTQDHLIDPYAYETLEWQHYLIKLMNRGGLQMRNISLENALEKNYDEMYIPFTNQQKTPVDEELLTPEAVVYT